LSLEEKDTRKIDRLKSVLKAFLLSDDEFEQLDENSSEKRIWSDAGFRFGVERTEALKYHCDQMETFKFPDSAG
jgi:hypothetical protein